MPVLLNLLSRCRRAFAAAFLALASMAALTAAPTITAQPQNQTVMAGTTATFSVTAVPASGGTLSYQWYRNTGSGFLPISMAMSASYTTGTTSTVHNGYQYQVKVTETIGWTSTSTTSAIATLTVTTASAPVISYSPNTATLTVGTAMAPMTPANSGGAATSWSVSPALPSGLGLNASTGVISGTPAAAQAATPYTVTATNAAGSGSATVTIAVNAAPQAPVITTQPVNQTVTQGSAASFTAAASGSPAPAWQWYKGTPPSGAALSGKTSATLTIASAQASDAGSYYAVATNSAGSATTSAATLTVNPPPAPTITSFTPASGPEGTSVTLAGTNFTGATSVKFNGTAAGFTVNSATQITATVPPGATTGTISVTTTGGTATSASSFTVTTQAPVITTQPQNATVAQGTSASFVAGASGSPSPTWQWYKGTPQSSVAIAGATSSTYTIASAQPSHAGSYYAVATNSAGSATTNVATLTVNPVPVISYNPATATLTVGTAMAPMTPTNSGGAATSWSVSPGLPPGVGLDVSTGVISGTPTAPSSQTVYTVMASNAAGQGTTTVTLTVEAPQAPTISNLAANPATLTSSTQSTVLSWTVTGRVTSQVLAPGNVPIPVGTTTISVTPGVTTTYTVTAYNDSLSASASVTVTVQPALGAMTWKRDIVYLGTKEVAEISSAGVTVTLVDHLGSPRFVVEPTGNVVEQKFLPFGESLLTQADQARVAKGFTNHEQTDPSGLIYMQARFYGPMYHRFLSPDPGRDQYYELTQKWNIYSYVSNNPMINYDPDGNQEKPASLRKLEAYAPNPARVPPTGQGILLGVGVIRELGKALIEYLADTPGDAFAVGTGHTITGDPVDRRIAAVALAIPFVSASAGKVLKKAGAEGGEILAKTEAKVEGKAAASAVSTTPSPALLDSPYHPDAVSGRIRPEYRPNPAHDPTSALFNPRKTPEPADAASVFSSASRANMGTWYGRGEGGWYRYFSDNAGGAHFSGIVPESQVPNAIRKQ